jgi:hypothetical protein
VTGGSIAVVDRNGERAAGAGGIVAVVAAMVALAIALPIAALDAEGVGFTEARNVATGPAATSAAGGGSAAPALSSRWLR